MNIQTIEFTREELFKAFGRKTNDLRFCDGKLEQVYILSHNNHNGTTTDEFMWIQVPSA